MRTSQHERMAIEFVSFLPKFPSEAMDWGWPGDPRQNLGLESSMDLHEGCGTRRTFIPFELLSRGLFSRVITRSPRPWENAMMLMMMKPGRAIQ